MLEDPLLRARIGRRIERQRLLADARGAPDPGDAALNAVARFYQDGSSGWRPCGATGTAASSSRPSPRSVTAGWWSCVASGATHGFLPLLRPAPRRCARRWRWAPPSTPGRFGRQARAASGCPSAATTRASTRVLAEEGLRYTFLDAHGLADAEPRPLLSACTRRPSPSRGGGLRARPRRLRAGVERRGGLPRRTRVYREFYRDIGWDLPEDALAPVRRARDGRGAPPASSTTASPGEARTRRSGRPSRALARAREHARHFVRPRRRSAPSALVGRMERDRSWSRRTTPSSSATGGSRVRPSSRPSSARRPPRGCRW